MAGQKQMDISSPNCFYIEEFPQREIFHGGIGNMDAEKIFVELGFHPLTFPHRDNFSFRAKWERFIFLFKAISKLPEGSVIIYQFPLYAKLHRSLIRALSSRRKFKVICFVTDIDGLKDGNDTVLKKEKEQLSRHHHFIVHNKSMENWLREFIPNANTASIDFFDFKAHPFTGNRAPGNEIVFAGNLYKSGFLKFLDEVNDEITFNLYGEGATDDIKNQLNVHYKGTFNPYKLPSRLQGSWGLVWDGDSVDGLAGSLGNYMKYISHHKLSSYIIAGLPLIVPEISAAAELVAKYKIGITVKSLKEISSTTSTITAEAYQQMTVNMKELSKGIIAGNGLRNAIAQAMESITKKLD